MNIECVKRPQRRFETKFDSQLNIQAYGEDNLYPQRMCELIDASSTGSTCLERYRTFIEGNGFNDTAFSQYICNRKGETVDDIFHLVACDLALYNGFALHVNYNMEGKIVELNHVPFESCRLEEETEDGKVVCIYFAVVMMVSIICVALGNDDRAELGAVIFICGIKGLSIVGNLLKMKGYRFDAEVLRGLSVGCSG